VKYRLCIIVNTLPPTTKNTQKKTRPAGVLGNGEGKLSPALSVTLESILFVHANYYVLSAMLLVVYKAGFTLRRLDRRLDKRPAPLVKVAKSL